MSAPQVQKAQLVLQLPVEISSTQQVTEENGTKIHLTEMMISSKDYKKNKKEEGVLLVHPHGMRVKVFNGKCTLFKMVLIETRVSINSDLSTPKPVIESHDFRNLIICKILGLDGREHFGHVNLTSSAQLEKKEQRFLLFTQMMISFQQRGKLADELVSPKQLPPLQFIMHEQITLNPSEYRLAISRSLRPPWNYTGKIETAYSVDFVSRLSGTVPKRVLHKKADPKTAMTKDLTYETMELGEDIACSRMPLPTDAPTRSISRDRPTSKDEIKKKTTN